MIDHDRLFKELLTTFFVEFIELFFPAVLTYLDTETIEFLNQEVFTDVTSGKKHEADIIVNAQEEEPIMEIVTSWMEQGIERGIEQGRMEGRELQAIELVLRLLPRRIGQEVTFPLEEQIRQLTLPQLEDLADALLDFGSVEDLQVWLERN